MSDQYLKDVEQTVSEIQQFVQTVERPDDWMIVVPVEQYGDVKESLDTTRKNLSTHYEGVPLCWGDGYDETKVKLKTNLSDYLCFGDVDRDTPGDNE